MVRTGNLTPRREAEHGGFRVLSWIYVIRKIAGRDLRLWCTVLGVCERLRSLLDGFVLGTLMGSVPGL